MTFKAGDVNDDDQLNIEDYNMMLGCFEGTVDTAPTDETIDDTSGDIIDDSGDTFDDSGDTGDNVLAAGAACSSDQSTSTDLNDDGTVDIIDLNLFITELSSYKELNP
jgi:hypothetical protein